MTRSRRRLPPGSRASEPGRPAPVAPASQPAPVSQPAQSAQPTPASQPALTLNALGTKCPVPIIMLADRIREVPIGQTIEVLADDPAARTDLPAWCTLKSQEFVEASDLPVGWSFLIRRSY